MNISATTSSAIKSGVLVGLASFVAGSVTPLTAVIVGTTYALVSKVTRPYFESHQAFLLGYFVNVALTTGVVNHLANLSLKATSVAYIQILPLVALAKIFLIGLCFLIAIWGFKALSQIELI